MVLLIRLIVVILDQHRTCVSRIWIRAQADKTGDDGCLANAAEGPALLKGCRQSELPRRIH